MAAYVPASHIRLKTTVSHHRNSECDGESFQHQTDQQYSRLVLGWPWLETISQRVGHSWTVISEDWCGLVIVRMF